VSLGKKGKIGKNYGFMTIQPRVRVLINRLLLYRDCAYSKRY